VKREIFKVISCGILDYHKARTLQTSIHAERVKGIRPDTILLMEHPGTITLGRRADKTHIRSTLSDIERKGIKVINVDRGGEATFHGLGQLIVYPIIRLREYDLGPITYIRLLEDTIIDALKVININGEKIKGETGVWVVGKSGNPKKIAALGVRISGGVTLHGAALNVSTDLSFFDHIIPCGNPQSEVTRVNDEISHKVTVQEISAIFVKTFSSRLRKTAVRETYQFV
jgi:lipoate-protein ligase B